MAAIRDSGENEKILKGLLIQDIARGGNGVARYENRVIFVPLTLPGDVVTARIVKTDKRFATAEVLEIEAPSTDRVTPPCAVFGVCGGCTWQHVPYDLQWKTKRNGALHALSRTGLRYNGRVEEFPAAHPWTYRNRIQLRARVVSSDEVQLGYYARGSREVVGIERCEIAREELNSRLPGIRAEALKRGGESKVELEVLPDQTVREVWDAAHGAMGFRQINDEQNDHLRAYVRANLSDGIHLLDLYGGSGNFSFADASRYAFVECVDVGSPEGGFPGQPANYRFYRSDVARWLDRRAKEAAKGLFKVKGSSVEVVLDPPREGLGDHSNKIARSLDEIGAEKIVAIGCDADSWARDMFRLSNCGWRLERVAIFDLFPQTPHVESVGVLVRD